MLLTEILKQIDADLQGYTYNPERVQDLRDIIQAAYVLGYEEGQLNTKECCGDNCTCHD